MVNRPKYDDFVQVGSTTKRFHDTDVSFVQFSCPMDGCNELVNVRDDEVDRIHHFFQDVYLVEDAAGQEELRHQARIAEPLRAFDGLSAGDQLRYYYDFEYAVRSRFYQYLSVVGRGALLRHSLSDRLA